MIRIFLLASFSSSPHGARTLVVGRPETGSKAPIPKHARSFGPLRLLLPPIKLHRRICADLTQRRFAVTFDSKSSVGGYPALLVRTLTNRLYWIWKRLREYFAWGQMRRVS
jgi:hypothetical protein